MGYRSLLACVCVGTAMVVGGSLSAGPLDPPAGEISSTYRTLLEVEPRTPIGISTTAGDANSVFRISKPGSYYLTASFKVPSGKHGIEIAVGDVSIDLNGFTIQGLAGSLSGISAESALAHLAIRHGSITSCGQTGVNLTQGGNSTDIHVEDILASGNGTEGLRVGNTAVVRGCEASSNGSTGIMTGQNSVVETCVSQFNAAGGFLIGPAGVLSRCSAVSNTGAGIFAAISSIVQDSAAYLNSDSGIQVATGCSVLRCIAENGTASGIVAGGGSSVIDCTAVSNRNHGISVATFSNIRGNNCTGNGLGASGAGILVSGSNNQIDANQSTGNDWGVRVTAVGNFISRNICSDNTTLNWDIVANNKCLVVNGANAGAISGNAGGVSPGSNDPHANFTY